ncbi:hypothetical protein LIT29_18205 [Rossellomorea marisflavi]|nr:ABC transporter permease subunit [Rossellomorea marisflavi]USK91423.1 hypothetical protein LIT29_18205 [Rossellomorea marisflavi]
MNVMKRFAWLLEPVLIIAGILLVSAGSGLFKNQSLSFASYGRTFLDMWGDLSHPFDLVYTITQTERPLFPVILLALWSSMRILFLAIAISLGASLILLIIYTVSGRIVKSAIKSIAAVLESVPDIFVIATLQLFIIWFFKKTGILLGDVASLDPNEIIFLPAVTLSVLPTFFFLGLMISFVKEEEDLPYVELARSKGLTKYRILFIHMIRNILVSLTYHGKQIVWMMLSNLLILEYLYNVFGVTSFLFTYNTPAIFAITSILLFLPIYGVLKAMQFTVKHRIGKEMSL